MNFSAFLEASTAVQVHVVFALFALASGAGIFIARKGSRLHRHTGRAWMGAMVLVAVSSFFIRQVSESGGFSALHGLAIYTIATIIFAVVMARRGDIRAHALSLTGLFLGGLLGAGLLTLSNGLLMSRILFPGGSPLPAPADLPGGAIGAAFLVAGITTAGTFAVGHLFDFTTMGRRARARRA